MTKDTNKIKLSKELRLLRGEDKKIVFAKKLGVSYRTYLRYESGERVPKESAMKLARILSKQVGYPLPEKPEVKSSHEYEINYDESRPVDELLAALKNILTNLDDRFTAIESRLATLEERKKIPCPGSAEEVTEKKAT